MLRIQPHRNTHSEKKHVFITFIYTNDWPETQLFLDQNVHLLNLIWSHNILFTLSFFLTSHSVFTINYRKTQEGKNNFLFYIFYNRPICSYTLFHKHSIVHSDFIHNDVTGSHSHIHHQTNKSNKTKLQSQQRDRPYNKEIGHTTKRSVIQQYLRRVPLAFIHTYELYKNVRYSCPHNQTEHVQQASSPVCDGNKTHTTARTRLKRDSNCSCVVVTRVHNYRFPVKRRSPQFTKVGSHFDLKTSITKVKNLVKIK